MEIKIPTRKELAEKVANKLLKGERLNQRQITKMANLEDSGRIVDFIRWKLWIPVECDDQAMPSEWFITDYEIYRYGNCRSEQIADQKAKQVDTRIDKIVNWCIDISKTPEGKRIVDEALRKIDDAVISFQCPECNAQAAEPTDLGAGYTSEGCHECGYDPKKGNAQ